MGDRQPPGAMRYKCPTCGAKRGWPCVEAGLPRLQSCAGRRDLVRARSASGQRTR